MRENKIYSLIFVTIIFIESPSYSQNNFEILISCNDTSNVGLYAKQMPDNNTLILSNNSYYYPGSGIFIEGVPTYESEITNVSLDGNILWKNIYSTNGLASWDMNETSRVPSNIFFNRNNQIIIPFSEYIGITDCDNTGNIVSFTYKTGIVLSDVSNGNLINKYIYYTDFFCTQSVFTLML